jgi:membrane protein DedA with SNARE-associated domain
VVQLVASLLAGGAGLPVPEELALAVGGYAMCRGEADGATLMVAALLAVVVGDLLLYALGRLAGRAPLVRRFVGEKRLAWMQSMFARHGVKLISIGRFVPGLRSGLFVAAGCSRMRIVHLLLCDVPAAGAGVALWFAVGARLGPQVVALAGLR